MDTPPFSDTSKSQVFFIPFYAHCISIFLDSPVKSPRTKPHFYWVKIELNGSNIIAIFHLKLSSCFIAGGHQKDVVVL